MFFQTTGGSFQRAKRRRRSDAKLFLWIAAIAATCALSYVALLKTNALTATASWVQAIGSILIIFATAWIANRNSREMRDREIAARNQLWESVATISEMCVLAVNQLATHCASCGHNKANFLHVYSQADVEIPLAGLAAVPLHQLGDARLITAVLTMRGAMARVQKQLSDAVIGANDPGAQLDLSFLGNKVPMWNAHARICRIVYGENLAEVEEKLRRLM